MKKKTMGEVELYKYILAVIQVFLSVSRSYTANPSIGGYYYKDVKIKVK